MSNQRKISAYKRVAIEARVAAASPYELISMLLEGELAALAAAAGAIKRKDIATKNNKIGSALDILSSLRDSLDKNLEQDLPFNLDRLYEYMQNQLLRANVDDDVAIIEEVAALISTIKSGWDSIESEVKQ